jgi:Tol biopolymer transport system component
VWIYDPDLSAFSKVTTVGTVASVAWSADGSRVVYVATMEGRGAEVWSQPLAGGLAADRLFSGAVAAVISPDGRTLAVTAVDNRSVDVLRVPLDSSGTAQPLIVNPDNRASNDHMPVLSPDGRWVALVSDVSGRRAVYACSFPGCSSRVQISESGGTEPVWSGDGTRVYYRTGAALMAARVALTPGVRLLGRETLVAAFNATGHGWYSNYDVAADGTRILAIEPVVRDYQLVVSPNWITEFRRKLAENRGR